jgi:hypothetical protein
LAAKEADLERRKRDVYEREQYIATHERAAHVLVAPTGATRKLRRLLYPWAPRWLIAAKRRMFGITGAGSDDTPSHGT